MAQSRQSRDKERQREAKKAVAARAYCAQFGDAVAKEYSQLFGKELTHVRSTDIQMSGVMIDFVEPYLHEVSEDDEKLMTAIYTFAANAWNMALDHELVTEDYRRRILSLPTSDADKRETLSRAQVLMDRKRQHFDQIKNRIVEIRFELGNVHVAHMARENSQTPPNL